MLINEKGKMKGNVHINFTVGRGNNIFQYCFGRLLAEAHNLTITHPPMPELGIIEQNNPVNRELRTINIGIESTDNNYHRFFQPTNEPCNYNIMGYFEDYTLYSEHYDKIRSWFPKVEKTNTEDLIIHMRLQNRLVQKTHHLNHINFDGWKRGLEKFDFKRIHIVTDAEKWDYHNEEDINKIRREVLLGTGSKEMVSVQDSIAYMNSLVDGFSQYDVIPHCTEAEMIKGSGGLRDNFIDDFNLISSFNNIMVYNSTFSWWASFFSNAEHIGVWEPWKPNKGIRNKNLGRTNYKGWFSWGSEDDLYLRSGL